jgi:hypothetical protein
LMRITLSRDLSRARERLRAEECSIFPPKTCARRCSLFLLSLAPAGFWNSILTYVTKTKDVKTAETETRQIEARAKKAILPKHGH